MIKPYDFVPFLKYIPYKKGNAVYDKGKIPIRVKTLTPVHISSGEYAVNGKNLIYKEFIKINGIPVIPATSFKGCVRSIAESVSHSYPYMIDDKKKELIPEEKTGIGKTGDSNQRANDQNENKKKEDEIKCIVCDMFGMMNWKSRIAFGDLNGVPGKFRLEIRGIPASFNPHPEREFYMEDGKYKGYKFYRHGVNGIQPKGEVFREFVAEDSWFEGEIIYRDLTEEQIQLLCFSLGLSGDINPKIGYGKNFFYGSIEVTSDAKWVEKAKEYREKAEDDIKKNIDRLISILSYKNAVSSPDLVIW